MNERIKKLADRAREQTEQFNSIRHKLTDEEWEEIYNEKFAKLIVRECDRYVAEHYDECEPWMEPGDLLKHFGVDL